MTPKLQISTLEEILGTVPSPLPKHSGGRYQYVPTP